MVIDDNQFVRLMRRYLAREGINQRELAKAVGVSESELSQVLVGRRSPGPKLLKFFGCRRERVITVDE